jgi:hypothetical protein
VLSNDQPDSVDLTWWFIPGTEPITVRMQGIPKRGLYTSSIPLSSWEPSVSALIEYFVVASWQSSRDYLNGTYGTSGAINTLKVPVEGAQTVVVLSSA